MLPPYCRIKSPSDAILGLSRSAFVRSAAVTSGSLSSASSDTWLGVDPTTSTRSPASSRYTSRLLPSPIVSSTLSAPDSLRTRLLRATNLRSTKIETYTIPATSASRHTNPKMSPLLKLETFSPIPVVVSKTAPSALAGSAAPTPLPSATAAPAALPAAPSASPSLAKLPSRASSS